MTVNDPRLMLDGRSTLTDESPLAQRAPRLLLTDDDALSRRLLGAALQRSGFEVLFAENGEEALRQLDKGAPDLLVLDFEMPGLNGAELCHRLRNGDREDWQMLPIIMLTAHAGEAEELGCLQAGANDFVTKPVSREILTARIETQLRLRSLSDELRRQNEELERWRAAQEADLTAAQATQRAFIPAHAPKVTGWSAQTIYQPVIQVGGDVFGWRQVSDGRWLFWLADATGHGAAAALFTALAAQIFHQVSETETDAASILRGVNDAFRSAFQGRMFMSACCAVIDGDGHLDFCSAGHPPLLVRRRDGSVESYGPHATMIGLQENTALERSELTLTAGDAALLYTDGLFAFKRPDGERFSHETVAQTLPAIDAGAEYIERLLTALQANSNALPCEDDIAAIVLLKS